MSPRPSHRLSIPVLATGLLMACANDVTAPPGSLPERREQSAIEHAVRHADPRYVCPMHPQIVRDDPGTCPLCGMDLVPKKVEGMAPRGGAEQGREPARGPLPVVTIRPETLQNMGVRTAQVERRTLRRRIDTLGYVLYDEDRQTHVHPRASGWVEKLYVRAIGDRVHRGQRLLELYAPEILSAQEEYLVALHNAQSHRLGAEGNSLLEAAQDRLRLLEVPVPVIRELRTSGKVQRTVPVLAPRAGVVTRMGIREGMYVTPSVEQFTITDLSTVWVLVEVFEHQQAWVETGGLAEIRVGALPGRVWQGEVDYIYPELDARTRTLRTRLRFANPDGALKPNMLADAVVYGSPRVAVLTVPRPALIVTGARTAVIRALDGGRFQPVEVRPGITSEGQVEILEGLQENDRVVVSGQFLIDSESNLQASFRRMGG